MPRGRNDYETAQIQGRLWTPAASRPALWLDASDLSTISIATGVSEWRDKSPNGRNVAQTTTTKQPALVNYQNSYGIKFDGSDDVLTRATGFDMKLCAVVLTGTGTGNRSYLGCRSSSPPSYNTNFGAWYMKSSGATAIMENVVYYDSSEANSIVASSTQILNESILISFYIISTGGYQFVRGLASGSDTVFSGSPVPCASTLYCGAAYYGGNEVDYFAGTIGEIICFDVEQTEATRQIVEGYLASKWRLELRGDHPFANRPPLIGD